MTTRVRDDEVDQQGHRDGPVLLVSSCGGHFTELELIADRKGLRPEERHWVVPRTPQTEHALSDATVTWMPRVESRQMGRAMRNLGAALALHRRLRPRLVLSAGAAQAVPHLVAASLYRTPVEYDESVARLDGPSVTGRLAAHLPATALVAPVDGWGGRWRHEADLFSGFDVQPATSRAIDSVMVALGTEHFGFVRAVELVLAALPGTRTSWQVGTTDFELDGRQLNRWLPPDVLADRMRQSSVVVVHGGAGSILTALGAGRVPIVLARSPEHGEHVDDHQVRMCASLADRGLVVLVRPGETLGAAHLERAAGLSARCRWSPTGQTDLPTRLAG